MKSSLSDTYSTFDKSLVQIIGQVLSNLRFKFFKNQFKFSIKATLLLKLRYFFFKTYFLVHKECIPLNNKQDSLSVC